MYTGLISDSMLSNTLVERLALTNIINTMRQTAVSLPLYVQPIITASSYNPACLGGKGKRPADSGLSSLITTTSN